MSFDLMLVRYRRRRTVPFDRHVVVATLARHARAEWAGDAADIALADGARLELRLQRDPASPNGCDACWFGLRPSSLASALAMQCIFDVAVAADLVVLNLQGEGTPASPSTILVSIAQEAQVERTRTDGHEFVVVASSAQALARALGASIDDWRSVASAPRR